MIIISGRIVQWLPRPDSSAVLGLSPFCLQRGCNGACRLYDRQWYHHVYFIPLCPVGQPTEMVRCLQCLTTYELQTYQAAMTRLDLLKPIQQPVMLSLETLYNGNTLKLPTSRKVEIGMNKFKQEQIEMVVPIQRGTSNNQQITFQRMGNRLRNVVPGDFQFVIKQKPHHSFARKGADLAINKEISLNEALTGFAWTMKHLDGREIRIKTRPGQIVGGKTIDGKTGETRPFLAMVRNEGMPLHSNPLVKGDLYVVLHVRFPTSLSSNAIELLHGVLPDAYVEKENISQGLEEHLMDTSDMQQFGSSWEAGIDGYDADFDGALGCNAPPQAFKSRNKTPSLQCPIKLSLADLYKGKTLEVAVERKVVVENPNNGSSLPRVKTMLRSLKLAPRKQETKLFEVHVKKGMSHNEKITFRGMGDEKPGWEPGDVHFVIEEETHHFIRRKGADLLFTQEISLNKALTGFKWKFKHLDGRKIVIKTRPGQIIGSGPIDNKTGVLSPYITMVKGEGMPCAGNSILKGNLYVGFYVCLPQFMSPESIQLLRKVLPDACVEEAVIPHNVSDEVYLDVADMRQFGCGGTAPQTRHNQSIKDDDRRIGVSSLCQEYNDPNGVDKAAKIDRLSTGLRKDDSFENGLPVATGLLVSSTPQEGDDHDSLVVNSPIAATVEAQALLVSSHSTGGDVI